MDLRLLKLISYLILSLSLSGCSFLDKALDNAATAMIGNGSATTGASIGLALYGPPGAVVGAGIGGSAGAILADKTIDEPPKTFLDIISDLINYAGLWLILGLLLPVLGVFLPSHREIKMRKKLDSMIPNKETPPKRGGIV